jgi:hypothetical protein
MKLAITTTPDRAALLGKAAFWSAAFATVLAPLHALARYATEDGKEDLDLPGVRAWAEPARDALEPLLDWASPDTVYLTYGKAWFPVFLIATLTALVTRARRGETRGAEKWGWRIASVGYVLATLSVLGDYWTPYLDESFLFLGMPGMLLSLVGSTVLGIGLLHRGYRPRTTAVLLVLWIPLMIVISNLVALGAAALPFLWAWGVTGQVHWSRAEAGVREPELIRA